MKANPKQDNLSSKMTIYSKTLAIASLLVGAISPAAVSAQIELPRTAATAGRDTIPVTDIATIAAPETQLTLHASLSARNIVVKLGDNTIKTFDVAVGQDRYPTPTGEFTIERIVWNPSWHPPPNAAWAKGKTAKGPGEPGNPMKVVKIFFQDPTYYIHGTGDVESLGSAASHGCLRMDPNDVAELAKILMEHGGEPHEENWFLRIIHSRREEKTIYLSNPIMLTIQG